MTEPAPTMLLRPIFAPFITIEPMPISAPSSMVQPCRMTLWPTVQFLPITMGKPRSVWQVEPSCTLAPSPISIHSLSPRSTAPNQTLAPGFRRTRPITVAVSAMK